MSASEEVAAALERLRVLRISASTLFRPSALIGVINEMERLLRFESQPEPATPAVGEDDLIDTWKTRSMGLYGNDGLWVKAAGDALAARLRYVEAELARLREGLKRIPGDNWRDDVIDLCCELGKDGRNVDPLIPGIANWSLIRTMAREIQRHRALATK